MSKDKLRSIVITGGGSGGHIYPGLAIGQALMQLTGFKCKIHFVGALGGLEEKILPKQNIPYAFLPVGRFHRSIGRLRQLKTLLLFPWTFLLAIKLYFEIKPKYILGVGGFASAPMLFVAILFRVPYGIWEANAAPGLVNRKFSKWSTHCFVVFERAKLFLNAKKKINSGMPVRKEFFEVSKNENFDQASVERKRLLIFGGSQGAQALNQIAIQTFTAHPELLNCIEVIHQTGINNYEYVMQQYGELSMRIRVLDYINDMPEAFSKADLILCRAGASTVAEVVTCKKRAIYVPLPTSADNHQLKNAQWMVEKAGATLIEQRDLNISALKNALETMVIQAGSEHVSLDADLDFSQSAEKIAQTIANTFKSKEEL